MPVIRRKMSVLGLAARRGLLAACACCIVEVAGETIEEAVRGLAWTYTTLHFDWEPLEDPQRALVVLQAHPRVRKLLRIASEGADAEKGALRDCILRMCERYVGQLPSYGKMGESWRPSAMHFGGGVAYSYILTHLDCDALGTLDLLVRMHTREQAAGRAYFGRESQKPVATTHAMLLAYACNHFLSLCWSREELKRGLTPAQASVLERFREYQETAPQHGKEAAWARQQRTYLGFAAELVGASTPEER